MLEQLGEDCNLSVADMSLTMLMLALSYSMGTQPSCLVNILLVAADGASCGFGKFPFFGEKALKWQWQFDFQLIYVGSGTHLPAQHNA